MPATPDEALRTSLMGMFEKRRFRSFLMYLAAYDEDNPDTFKGMLIVRVRVYMCTCSLGNLQFKARFGWCFMKVRCSHVENGREMANREGNGGPVCSVC